MIFGYLTLFTALILSLSAAVYSILGLTAIFAAAFWPIVILGGSLEIGKIVTTLWLHKYWTRAELQYKLYLCSAVVILMVLTSMGVFGFLSKAHLDQAVPSGDIQAQVQIFDDKIQTQKDNIKTARAALTQMDTAVDQVMGRSQDEKGADKAVAIRRSQDEKGADKAVAIRRSQARERTALQTDISKAQTEITKLQEGRAPIASQARKVEAEVGPIKYIAALIYGDNPDANVLEKAVRYVIILIVVVFDPLALTLLLAATKTFEWERGINILAPPKKDNEDKEVESWFARAKERARFWDKKKVEQEAIDVDFEGVRINGGEWIQTGPEIPVPKNVDTTDNLEPVFDRETDIPAYEPDDGPLTDKQIKHIREIAKDDLPTGEVITKESLFLDTVNNRPPAKDPSIPGWMFVEPPIPVTNNDSLVVDEDLHDDDEDQIDASEKEAQRKWKIANPKETIKQHRQLHRVGLIDELPWMHSDYQQVPNPINESVDLGLSADNVTTVTTGEMRGFGTSFPANAAKGDMFLRVDRLPSTLYKFNGNLWIEVDKALSDQHAYNEAYIDHLIEKISTGEYDPDLLSDAERASIELRLNTPSTI